MGNFCNHCNNKSTISNPEDKNEVVISSQKVFSDKIQSEVFTPSFVSEVRQVNPSIKRQQNAINKYQKAIEQNPKDKDAYENLQIAYQRLNRMEQALKFYQQQIEKYPEVKYPYFYLAKHSKNQEEVIKNYTKVLEIDPQDAEAHYNLGRLEYQSNLDKAINHFQQTININAHHSQALNNLGVIYLSQNKLNLAINYFHMALKENPRLAKTHLCLGNALCLTNQKHQAVKSYCKAIENDGNLVQAYESLRKVLNKIEDNTTIIEVNNFLETLSENNPENNLMKESLINLRKK